MLSKSFKVWLMEKKSPEDLVYVLDLDPIEFIDALERMKDIDWRELEAEYLAEGLQYDLDYED